MNSGLTPWPPTPHWPHQSKVHGLGPTTQASAPFPALFKSPLARDPHSPVGHQKTNPLPDFGICETSTVRKAAPVLTVKQGGFPLGAGAGCRWHLPSALRQQGAVAISAPTYRKTVLSICWKSTACPEGQGRKSDKGSFQTCVWTKYSLPGESRGSGSSGAGQTG